ncbi:hypothetical protein SOMG_01510 [Schizosaccharomyces osmophilus]|uniref:Uncharacterized protein n=1 Tax=Schizosaccharomyces osmophilus TaxID=2545709 RepID=A0AAE9W9W3_9SCHI|nr:uncharacterized protein SOMG_01510 [Schizosaccharomyces osmophilus]WBW72344.1 hypothetical protein SOMG_01510 [Schizosaccharomyces osmophilus]
MEKRTTWGSVGWYKKEGRKGLPPTMQKVGKVANETSGMLQKSEDCYTFVFSIILYYHIPEEQRLPQQKELLATLPTEVPRVGDSIILL